MKLDVYTYEFPFTKPFSIASGTFSKRKGLYLRFNKNGIIAWGEAAPLPGFSNETLSDVNNQLKSHHTEINELFERTFSLESIQSYLNSTDLGPALQFAIYTLAATWLAQNQRQSLHDYLFSKPKSTIPVNAVLGLEEQNIMQRLDQFAAQGFKTLKIKADHQTGRLISTLEKIRKEYPQFSIRIDANQSWSAEQAADCLQRIEDYSIEYCEEPLENPDGGKLEKLGSKTKVAIALDESLAGTFSLSEAAGLASVLILKPTILGIKALPGNISEQTKTHSKKIIFTTALESGIGRLMAASLAAGRGSSDSAHGLGTGDLLKNDIWSDALFINDGNFCLPDADQLARLMNQKVKELPMKRFFCE
jgi:O-succinylbenzoate synthase